MDGFEGAQDEVVSKDVLESKPKERLFDVIKDEKARGFWLDVLREKVNDPRLQIAVGGNQILINDLETERTIVKVEGQDLHESRISVMGEDKVAKEICQAAANQGLYVENASYEVGGEPMSKIHLTEDVDEARVSVPRSPHGDGIFVGQGEYVILDPKKGHKLAYTKGMGPCSMLHVTNRDTGVTLLAHIDRHEFQPLQVISEALPFLRAGSEKPNFFIRMSYADEDLARVPELLGAEPSDVLVQSVQDYGWNAAEMRELDLSKDNPPYLTREEEKRSTESLYYRREKEIDSAVCVFNDFLDNVQMGNDAPRGSKVR